MSPLLAPILAQLITLSVGDRTEARYVVTDYTRFEGATRPVAGLTLAWKRATLTIAYSPSFTVIPLEREPRDLLIFQNGSVSASYHWRHTTATLTEAVGYGELAFQVQALADPGVTTPGGATPPPPTGGAAPAGPGGTPTGGMPTPPATPQATNQLRISKAIVHYVLSSTTLGVTHEVSRTVAVGADANYTVAGGVGSSAAQYPAIDGEHLGVFASHSLILNRRDTVTSSLTGQYSTSSLGNQVWSVFQSEVWSHKLDPRTVTRLGAGISGSRLSQDSGLVSYSVYPTFLAGISHFDRLGGGMLTLGANASAAPFIDPLRATVDPRLTVGLNSGWAKDPFSIGLSAGAAISIADDNSKGAVNSVGATLSTAYRLGTGVSVDAGATAAWQTFEGATIIPPSWLVFLGVTFGAQLPLNHR